MLDSTLPDLTFPRMPIGTHGTPWDLKVLLYRGGAETNRRKVSGAIAKGKLGRPILTRAPLVICFHEQVQARLERGDSFRTVGLLLARLFSFVSWADAKAMELSLETIRDAFLSWAEHLIHRCRIKKDLKEGPAYGTAVHVAALVGVAIDCSIAEPGRALMKHTRLRATAKKKAVLGAQADKQRLDQVFEFGHFITDISIGLSRDAIRGALPVSIPLRSGQNIQLKGFLKRPALDPQDIINASDRRRAIRARAPLAPDVSAIEIRPYLINLRIEAELLIFLAQTGMNFSQAAKLRREQYRWQSEGNELNAFRVYKGRRSGEAIFRCFKAYRAHLTQYLAWVDEMGLSEEDDRLFPFIYHRGGVPPEYHDPSLAATALLCSKVGIKHFRPQVLRKTRVNWLLRRSRDPALTAEQSAHMKETLLKDYEEPHYQSAIAEIIRFHRETDPTMTPPGPGVCVAAGEKPQRIDSAPPESPEPDCISPDGCLFCQHHRDVMNGDYCWRLASHSRLKNLEALLLKPAKSQPVQPAHAVIARIDSKLEAIAAGSDIRAQWVTDARDAIRSERYHPLWDTQIQLLDTLI